MTGIKKAGAWCPPFRVTESSGNTLKRGHQTPEVNWRNFQKAGRLAQVNAVSTVLITGKGEPTLYPEQVTRYLEELRRFEFPLLELQTNGLLLGRKDYARHLRKWYALGLNTLAVSIVHYEDERNRTIFAPKGRYPALRDLLARLHETGFSVRLSCVLMRGYIDCPEELRRMAEFAKANGVEQLTFRKLGLIDDAEDASVRKWCVQHALREKEIRCLVEFLEREAKKLMTLSHGAVVYELDGQNVCMTDCVMIKPQSDEIRTLIFFPDGHLRYNWDYGGAIIL